MREERKWHKKRREGGREVKGREEKGRQGKEGGYY